MLSVVQPDQLDWGALAEGARHTVAPPWLELARGRLTDPLAFCLRDGDGVQVAMWGRMVDRPTSHPYTDPHRIAAARLGDAARYFPALSFMYPNYEAFPVGPGARDPGHLRRFVAGLRRWAETRDTRALVFQFVGPEGRPLCDLLAQDGFDVFPVAHRAELSVGWSDLRGYLDTFPKQRRDSIKHEIRTMAAAGLRFEVRGLGDHEPELRRLRGALVVKYGGVDDAAREEELLRRVRDNFRPDDVHVVVARDGDDLVAFTIFIRDAGVLTALITGADYQHPKARYVYFGTAFYTAVQLAADLGVRTIEYGLGSEAAKRSRGCALVPLFWAVATAERSTPPRPDGAHRRAATGAVPRPRAWTEALPSVGARRPVSTGPGSLASNEPVLPASDAAVAAMAAAAHRTDRYPSMDAAELRAAIAEEYGLDMDNVVVSNGSEEVLYLLLNAYAGGGRVAMADPACGVHDRLARLVGAQTVTCPTAAWTHDLDAFAGCVADVAVICNPHNPTGTVVSRQAVAGFLDHHRVGLVVVDEAYVDFADDPSTITCADLVHDRSDLAVVRTFSKIHGLAGARVGYLLAAPPVAATVRKLQMTVPVNAAAQAGAVAALRDHGHRDRVWRLNRQMRDRLTELLTRAGYEVVASQANFVLVLTPDEDDVVGRLAAAGVTVRPGRATGLAGSVRVTVPGPAGLALVAEGLGIGEGSDGS